MGLSESDQGEKARVSGDVVVRQFRAADLPQVVEVFKTGMRSYSGFRAMSEQAEMYLQESLDGDLSDIHGTYIAPGGNFWVATSTADPTEVVGFVGLEPNNNNEGELRRMSVKDSYRRRGVGRTLIAALEQWAQRNGFRKVWLTTGSPMDKARAFYPSVGFEQTAVTVVSEEPHFEAHTLEKRLAPAAPSHANATCSPADIVVRQFRPEDFDQVVTLFKDGMMHYPAHKTHAELLEQHLNRP